jgi:methyl-accepting chemotaxis protein
VCENVYHQAPFFTKRPFLMGLNNIKVGSRLALAFGLVLLTAALVAGIGVWRLQELASTSHTLVTKDAEKLKLAVYLQQTFNLSWVRTRAIALDSDISHIPMWQAEMSSTTLTTIAAHKRLVELVELPQGKALLAQIETTRNAFRDARTAMIKNKMAGEDVMAQLEHSVKPLSDAYVAAISEFEKFQQGLYATATLQVQENAANGRLILIIGSALALLLGTISAIVLGRSITTPLQQAVRSARAIAEGDLTQPIYSSGRDEAAELLQALQTMQTNLVTMIGHVRQGTDSIAAASNQIASGNSDLSARTEQQASALKRTAASMDQLTSAVRQNADNARQANQLAVSASTVAVQGGSVVSQVVDTMGAINASSRKIADIISVIDSIAFQTNILALNAAVEAARAGEQGRGFAVVASEVRLLAGRSAAAAKEIKELIDESASKVSAGTTLVGEAGKTMDNVVGSIQRVTDIMGEITAAGQEQTAGIEQVNQSVIQMDQVTQQNAALVEEAAAAAQSLQEQASGLAHTVSAFKLQPGGMHFPDARPSSPAFQTTPAQPAQPTHPSRPSNQAKPSSHTAHRVAKPLTKAPPQLAAIPKATPKALPKVAPKIAPKAALKALPAPANSASDDWESF